MTARLSGGKGGKGVKGGFNRPAPYQIPKKGKGKEKQEVRKDPSDGNGPFTLKSFFRYHGPERGQELWDQAGRMSDSAATKAPKEGIKLADANAGQRNPFSNDSNDLQDRPAKRPAILQKLAVADAGKTSTKGTINSVRKGGKKDSASAKKGPQEGKKGAGKISNGHQKGGQDSGHGIGKGGKIKGEGKKGKVSSKKGGGKKGAEKRTDPSDGNGPFSFQSFLKYHGEEKGRDLWAKAGDLLLSGDGGRGADPDLPVDEEEASVGAASAGLPEDDLNIDWENMPSLEEGLPQNPYDTADVWA